MNTNLRLLGLKRIRNASPILCVHELNKLARFFKCPIGVLKVLLIINFGQLEKVRRTLSHSNGRENAQRHWIEGSSGKVGELPALSHSMGLEFGFQI
jgi:hypothetical protein